MFGSFLGSFYTGGIRIPLRTTDENFVGLWLGLLLLMRDLFKAFLTFMHCAGFQTERQSTDQTINRYREAPMQMC